MPKRFVYYTNFAINKDDTARASFVLLLATAIIPDPGSNFTPLQELTTVNEPAKYYLDIDGEWKLTIFSASTFELEFSGDAAMLEAFSAWLLQRFSKQIWRA